MEPEQEVARVNGLGRGSLLGFSLVLTDQRIVGIDTRKLNVRLWLGMMLGLGLGIILVVTVISSGLEPVLFRIHPLVSFIGIFALVLSIPILMVVLVPHLLMGRLRRTANSNVQAFKRDILRIEVRKPGRVTGKGYFTVRLLNGTSFSFWTVGRDMFDHVNSLLINFAPSQITDLSEISAGQITDLELDRPSNRVIVWIFAFLILTILVGVGVLLPFVTLSQLVDYAVGVIVLHLLAVVGYLVLRRSRRRHRRV